MTTIQLIEEHFKEHRKALLKSAKRRVGEYWAEDAVMDAYEGAIRYAGNKAPVASLGAYINYILSVAVRKYENDTLSDTELEEWMWESGELADEMRAKGVLQNVLEDLCLIEDPARTCVYLHIVQGEKSYKVSEITGVSEASVRKMCERFRHQMREKYGQD